MLRKTLTLLNQLRLVTLQYRHMLLQMRYTLFKLSKVGFRCDYLMLGMAVLKSRLQKVSPLIS